VKNVTDLNGTWELSEADGKESYGASVPGDVRVALSENGVLPEELFYRKNLEDTNWVEQKTWVYRREFDFNDDVRNHLNLVFNGLDLFASVYLNGVHLGDTQNMFLQYKFDTKEHIKQGSNEIVVQFKPTKQVVDALNEKYPGYMAIFYPGRSLVRKAQCQFGWDWEPDAISIGIWKNVFVENFDDETIEDIFHDVEHGRVRYGIVPVENSIEGSVTSTLDSFMKYKVQISGEVNLGIKHNLVNYSGSQDDIKLVVSHSQPLAQCRQWLKKNLPNVPTQTVFSTGVAAQMAADDHSVAAIASTLAIKTYHLQIVATGVEDYRGNTTRFLLIGPKSPTRSGKDKTSLLLSLLDRPGALNSTLSILAERGINLTKIESRPVKGEVGKYMFFIDMLGHIDDKVINEATSDLRRTCASFRWLGSYPQMDQEDE